MLDENNSLIEKKNKTLDITQIIKICHDFKKTVLDKLIGIDEKVYNRRTNHEFIGKETNIQNELALISKKIESDLFGHK